MALGYCMHCDTLRTIRPGPQKWGSRECEWAPTAHWIMVHKNCPIKAIVTEYGEFMYLCPQCGVLPANEVDEQRCPGEGKAIK